MKKMKNDEEERRVKRRKEAPGCVLCFYHCRTHLFLFHTKQERGRELYTKVRGAGTVGYGR